MNRDELVSQLVLKSNTAPIFSSEIANVYPEGTDDYNYVSSELDKASVEVIDDIKELDDEFLSEAEDTDVSQIDLTNIPFRGNLVDLYLRDIAPYPVLTQDEECELFKKIEAGKAIEDKLGRSVAGIEVLPAEEFDRLQKIAMEADIARNRIINCNLRLVVYNAKNYNNRGLSFMDLIQEGSMGLMVAISKFDYTRGFKFSTYATAWIKQHISRSLDLYSRTIRVPSHIIEKNNKINDATRRLSQELGRDPYDEEVAKECGLTVAKLREIKQAIIRPTSLEKPIGADEDSTIGDFVQDPNEMNPYEYTKKQDLKETLKKCFETLSEREAQVLILRYGFGGEKPLTLEEVGLRFDLTRERIRQIEAKAIKRLRCPKIMEMLKDFKNND